MGNTTFAAAAFNAAKETKTENGAFALNTSNDALVDLYSTIGALREADDQRVLRLFSEAYKEDKLLATKILFYARDIEGLGERKTFRTIIKHMATYMPEALRPNLKYIGSSFGRFDDLYELVGTPLENDMWSVMQNQFELDVAGMVEGKPVSLLAKWIKTADASSEKTRKLGILTAVKLGYDVRVFKRAVRNLRKYLKVTEGLMSTKQWDKIVYSEVPSIAMHNYGKAFGRHDQERFNEFVSKAVKGEVKINSGTLYPYNLVEPFFHANGYGGLKDMDDDTANLIEAQWRQLPNYVTPGSNVVIMADTSGSMWGRPLCTAVGLAIYFAERNTGAYKDLWMSFSQHPTFHKLKGDTLREKILSLDMNGWDMNTDLGAAMRKILEIAKTNHIAQEDMPKALVVISDMEIDQCTDRNDTLFYKALEQEFEAAGYQTPKVVFWNVNSRHDIFHADAHRPGVQLVSGQSATVFKQLMDNIELSAYEAMLQVVGSERYDCITVD